MSRLNVANFRHPDGTSDNITLDSSGRVGVGTASPGTYNAKLAIYGTDQDSSRIALFRSGNAGTSISVDGGLVFGADGSTGGTARMKVTNTGNVQFDSGYGSVATAYGCRAWVNFNGTGTVAIRDSGNVTSISDHGIGDYSLNFTNSMPDTNYCLLGTSSGNANHNSQALSINYTTAPTTSAVRIFTAVPGSSTTIGFKLDTAYNCVAIVR